MIYFVLIFTIILLSLLLNNSNHSSRNKKRFLIISFALIYLLFVLRDVSVGRDLPGYETVYKDTASVPFGDFNYVYFENGYVFLMKICNLFHFSFRVFLFVAYAIMLIPIGIFIYKYSSNVLFSVILYICYMFMDFYFSGLRQGLAMSISLIAIMLLLKYDFKIKGIILFYLVGIIAYLFHRSAFIIAFIPLLRLIKEPMHFIYIFVPTLIILLVFRTQTMTLIKNFFNKETMEADAELYFGFNVVALIAIAAVYLFFYTWTKRGKGSQKLEIDRNNIFFFGIFVMGVVISIFFGTDTTARSFMYYILSIWIVLPNLIKFFDRKTSRIVSAASIILLIIFFGYQLFTGHTFDIYPYKFFFI